MYDLLLCVQSMNLRNLLSILSNLHTINLIWFKHMQFPYILA